MTMLLTIYIIGAVFSLLFALVILSSTFRFVSRHTLPEQPQTLLFGFIHLRYVGFVYLANTIILSVLIIIGTVVLWQSG